MMYTKACHFCGQPARIEGNHWTGTEYVRVPICSADFAAGKLARHPRKPRQRRTRQDAVPATDWNYLVAFNSGRKSSR